MANTAVMSLKGPIDKTFALAAAYIDVCPENIWGKKFGGWPAWQQLYHGLAAIDFFLRGPDDAQAKALYDHAVGDLKETPAQAPDKAAFKSFLETAKARIDAYCAGLDDADLAKNNPGLSKRFGADMTHAITLSLMAGHLFYHLGGCDAALRENGLKGVF